MKIEVKILRFVISKRGGGAMFRGNTVLITLCFVQKHRRLVSSCAKYEKRKSKAMLTRDQIYLFFLWLSSENLNTRPLARKQVDFLVDKLIFQQLAWMGKWENVTINYVKKFNLKKKSNITSEYFTSRCCKIWSGFNKPINLSTTTTAWHNF